MKRSTWWLIAGIISAFGGVIALLNPFAASITAEIIAAITFLVSGVALIIGLFSAEGAGTKLWMGLLGAAMVFLGWQLFANPLAGLLSLTAAVGLLLAFEGIAKLFLSFSLDRNNGFWLMLLSAALSLLLSFMIFSSFPISAVSVLGIFLGVDLLMNGISLIVLSNETKKLENAIA